VDTPTGQELAQRIAAGDADGHLTAIIEAVQARVADGAAAFQWEIRWGDLEVTESDLTLDEALTVEKTTGSTWQTIDPLRSATHCRAILHACIVARTGVTSAEADAVLAPATVHEIIEAISKAEVNPAPLDSET